MSQDKAWEDQDTERFYNRGKANLGQGSDSKAIADFNEVLRHEAGNSAAYRAKAEALRARGNIDDAIMSLGQAISWGRTSPAELAAIHYNLGNYFNDRTPPDPATAIYNFGRAVGLDDHYFEAFMNRAKTFKEIRCDSCAILDYERAMVADPKKALESKVPETLTEMRAKLGTKVAACEFQQTPIEWRQSP
jgi:tetratricopeptide (TPR) repeat protein